MLTVGGRSCVQNVPPLKSQFTSQNDGSLTVFNLIFKVTSSLALKKVRAGTMTTDVDCVRLCDGPLVETSNFVWINDQEIAVAAFGNGRDNRGIHIYNIISTEWRLHIKYPNYHIQEHSICYNPNTKTLWLHGDNSELININMQTKKFKIIKTKNVGMIPRLILIRNKLHVILGSDNTDHLIWNDIKKEFESIFTFPWEGGLHAHQIIHVKSKGLLYLIGGCDEYAYGSGNAVPENKYIWKCEINNNYKWIALSTDTKDIFLYYAACILTPDESMIIIFNATRIYLFNVEKEEFYDSGIVLKCKEDIEKVLSPNYAILCG